MPGFVKLVSKLYIISLERCTLDLKLFVNFLLVDGEKATQQQFR